MLPKNIDNCPLVDSLVEIRFNSNINQNAIFGIIYNSLMSDFKKVENLPILQIPEAIRKSDPNLKNKPLYRISNEKYVIQIGIDVLTIGSHPKYVGWGEFSKTIYSILDKIDRLKIIQGVYRLGLRYVNFFEDDNIFKNIKLDVNLSGKSMIGQKSVFRTEIKEGNVKSVLQISNDAKSKNKSGSLIDIDCSRTSELQDFFKKKEELINNIHSTEKKLFFKLINDDYLKKLNPTY